MKLQQGRHEHFIESLKTLRLAHKIEFYGVTGCMNCAYIYPLLSIANRAEMVQEVAVKTFTTKEQYREAMEQLYATHMRPTNNYPIPTLVLQQNVDSGSLLVAPEVVEEVATELAHQLGAMGDMALMEYMDGELELRTFFLNLLLRLVSQTFL